MKSDKLKTRPVLLETIHSVKFAQHDLPPGRYIGMQHTAGVRTGSGLVWSEPTYTLKLTPPELHALGWGLSESLSYAAQDVIDAVRLGRLKVHL